MASYNATIVHYLLVVLMFSDVLLGTYAQIRDEHPAHTHLSPSETVEGDSESVVVLRSHDPHHIVKRKSKMGRGFGFGKSKSKTKVKNQPAYPKQPAHNPNYNPGHQAGNMGPPPAYPGQGSYPGRSGMNYPHQPPPAYPHNPSYPSYPQGGHNTGFGGNNYNNKGFGYGKSHGSGGGLGRTLGSAGFGALAGTALGAYGGYKLGRMVGGLGRNGHYGYYSDNGRYVRCDPPKNIKIDPETNKSYIPLEEDYDKRCHYYDRPPQPYFNGYISSAGTVTLSVFAALLSAILVSMFNFDLNQRTKFSLVCALGAVVLL